MAWYDRLRPASFRGAMFHVEIGGMAGGRRIAMHEFPKRDRPYAEDLGRRARRFEVVGYLVGPDYLFERDDLLDALQREGAGSLVHPSFGQHQVVVDGFRASERRERGGFVEIDMQFSESGDATPFSISASTQGIVEGLVEEVGGAIAGAINEGVRTILV